MSALAEVLTAVIDRTNWGGDSGARDGAQRLVDGLDTTDAPAPDPAEAPEPEPGPEPDVTSSSSSTTKAKK